MGHEHCWNSQHAVAVSAADVVGGTALDLLAVVEPGSGQRAGARDLTHHLPRLAHNQVCVPQFSDETWRNQLIYSKNRTTFVHVLWAALLKPATDGAQERSGALHQPETES